MELREFFEIHPKAAIACSGGVDSAFLLYQAVTYGKNVEAFMVKSDFQPEFELTDAKKLCRQLGVKLHVISVTVMENRNITDNPSNRCYFCKKEIFGAIREAAAKAGFQVLLEGTNASDDISDRPGVKALEEYGVLSPLRECGYTKERIRREAKQAGLFVHDKPAYACLATRIPCGQKITGELLKKIEEAEKILFASGFADFRVRIYYEAARIQLKESQMPMFLEKRKEVVEALAPFFQEVLLDCRVSR